MIRVPRYEKLRPSSEKASAAARGSSRKKNTKCEVVLRRLLWRMGLRYRVNFQKLPGKPDIVFPRERLVVFCDGDFWHGRNLESRLARLSAGHNAPYWVSKIQRNVERDREQDSKLLQQGWAVLRLWETDIVAAPEAAAKAVVAALARPRGSAK